MKDLSLNINNSEAIIEKLNFLLADLSVHYQNLRNLHWNVRGKMFHQLHEMYEGVYTAVSDQVDEVAERILMLEGQPFSSMSDFVKNARLEEAKIIHDGETGVKLLASETKYFIERFREIIDLAGDSSDEGTVAMMSALIESYEKQLWMLRATLA